MIQSRKSNIQFMYCDELGKADRFDEALECCDYFAGSEQKNCVGMLESRKSNIQFMSCDKLGESKSFDEAFQCCEYFNGKERDNCIRMVDLKQDKQTYEDQ